MDFLTTLLQTISFVPTLVTGIEGLFSHRSGTEKKDAALSFLQTALSIATQLPIDRSSIKTNFGTVWGR